MLSLTGTLFVLLFGPISIWLWVHAVTRYRQGATWFGSPEERLKLPIGMVDVGIAFVLFLAGQFTGAMIAMLFLGASTADPSAMDSQSMATLSWAVGITQAASTTVTLLWLWMRYQKAEVFGWKAATVFRDLGLGLAVFLMFVPLTFAVQAALTQIWEYEHPTLNLISADAPLWTILAAWWMAVLVAPVTEEIFFRGILQGWLSRVVLPWGSVEGSLLGGWPVQSPRESSTSVEMADRDDRYIANTRLSLLPVFVSALLFALVHLGQGPAPIPIFIFGVGLGLLYRKTGRILPCITAHFLLNFVSMSVLTVETFFPATLEDPLTPAPVPQEVAPVGAMQTSVSAMPLTLSTGLTTPQTESSLQ